MEDIECVGHFLSPLGFWEVAADSDGVISIHLLPEKVRDDLKHGIATQDAGPAKQHVQDCLDWLKAYFVDASTISRVKCPTLNTVAFASKPFCCKVWKVLQNEVGPGETVSYGELAKMVGNQNAARAVGMAMKTNPTPIIVPCHRVVSRNGIGYYSAVNGTDTKRWLLRHEKADFGKIEGHGPHKI